MIGPILGAAVSLATLNPQFPMTKPAAEIISVKAQAVDDATIVGAFVPARAEGYEVEAGTEVALLDTLLAAELPDYDPLSDRETISLKWTLDGADDVVTILEDQSWDAALLIDESAAPQSFTVTVHISRNAASRSLKIPIVITR